MSDVTVTGTAPKILLVDDELSIRQLLSYRLKREGFEVLLAENGRAAVKMLEDNLAQVPPRVLSKAGRSRVAARANELSQFLKRLRQQSADVREL